MVQLKSLIAVVLCINQRPSRRTKDDLTAQGEKQIAYEEPLNWISGAI